MTASFSAQSTLALREECDTLRRDNEKLRAQNVHLLAELHQVELELCNLRNLVAKSVEVVREVIKTALEKS